MSRPIEQQDLAKLFCDSESKEKFKKFEESGEAEEVREIIQQYVFNDPTFQDAAKVAASQGKTLAELILETGDLMLSLVQTVQRKRSRVKAAELMKTIAEESTER